MQIIKQACGVYETNCYILFTPKGEFIIDPGTD
ncbi:MBL fold metallo-hydrolase, partial [Campylobacter jejuni]|nr:MBL fold metallo-hydrolase [Campylobacter jejuni]